jgi:hypothetical protein
MSIARLAFGLPIHEVLNIVKKTKSASITYFIAFFVYLKKWYHITIGRTFRPNKIK